MSIYELSQKQIIAQILHDNNNYFEVSKHLDKEMFTEPFKGYYANIEEKHAKNISVMSLCSGNDTNYKILSDIERSIDYDISIYESISVISDHYKSKSLKEAAFNAISCIENNSRWQEASEKLNAVISALNASNKDSVLNAEQIVKEMLDIISSKDQVGYKTGFTDFDKFTGGLQKSDLVIIAGDTSQGKTSLAINFLLNLSIEVPCVFYSMEMSSFQLTTRLTSILSSINSKNIQQKRLSGSDKIIIEDASKKLKERKIFVDECNSTNLSHITSSIHRMKLQHDIKVVFIDYLQLVRGEKGLSREQEVGTIARRLKNTAKELDICIVCLSQLNRSKNKRDGNMPMLSDLRDSGQIEEAADIVMLLYRPEHYGIMIYENGESTQGKADLMIAKGRNVGITTIPLQFNKFLTKFSNIDETPF